MTPTSPYYRRHLFEWMYEVPSSPSPDGMMHGPTDNVALWISQTCVAVRLANGPIRIFDMTPLLNDAIHGSTVTSSSSTAFPSREPILVQSFGAQNGRIRHMRLLPVPYHIIQLTTWRVSLSLSYCGLLPYHIAVIVSYLLD
jgi:hypothetical protein